MDTEAVAGRAKLVMRTAAVLAGALGLYIIYAVVFLPVATIIHEGVSSSILTVILVMTPVIIYGGYCLFAARKLWTNVSAENVHRISIVAAILFGSLFVALPWLPESWWRLTLVGAMAVGGIFYMLCIRLLRWLGLPYEIDWGRREKSVKRFFWLLAFIVFSAGFEFAMNMKPVEPGYWSAIWPMLALLASLVVAVIVYYVCTRVALRNKPRTPGDKPAATPPSRGGID